MSYKSIRENFLPNSKITWLSWYSPNSIPTKILKRYSKTISIPNLQTQYSVFVIGVLSEPSQIYLNTWIHELSTHNTSLKYQQKKKKKKKIQSSISKTVATKLLWVMLAWFFPKSLKRFDYLPNRSIIYVCYCRKLTQLYFRVSPTLCLDNLVL